MKDFLEYDLQNFKIAQVKWDKNVTAKTESIMALGNGYLGLRSVDEEIESFNKEGFFVNGVFNKENKDEVPELVNLANSIQNTIYLNKVRFSLRENDGYCKTLNLKNGVLTRIITAKRSYGTFKIKFERFVSQLNKHVYAQKITISQLKGSPVKLEICPMINGQTTNQGAQHLKEGQKRRTNLSSVQYLEETSFSNVQVIHNLLTKATSKQKTLPGGTDDYLLTMSRRQIGFKIKSLLSKSRPFTLENIMTVNTSVDDKNKKLAFKEVKEKAWFLFKNLEKSTYGGELKKSNKLWKEIYNRFFVKITGSNDEAKYDQMANVFGVFHMNSFVPKDNPNLSVGAKGLSGEGYQGHTFWDTEFFVMPNYLFTTPEIAKNLLIYRYKGIQGARQKARELKVRKEESNLLGAQYPWEMAWPPDGEVCPSWGQADVVSGVQEPIASRRQEIHVSAAVAFAVYQYFDTTKDQNFMKKMGYEMIFDTAVFWANRAEKQKNGIFKINDVMGPNEYKGNVNNNAYTNAMARFNIDLALKYKEILSQNPRGRIVLKAVQEKIPYKIPWSLMEEVSKKLFQQKPDKKLVIAENDEFLTLERNDVTEFQLLGDAGKKLFSTKAGQKLLSGQLVKQADVVLLNYLLPKLTSNQVKKNNFEFYEPITTHDSSLSPTTYAITAIDLRKMGVARKLFKYSLNIDMGQNMFSSNAGVHAGSLAAIWQTTVFGYGGFRWISGEIHLNPILPEHWSSLEYHLKYRKINIFIKVFQSSFSAKTNGPSLGVFVNNQAETIGGNKRNFRVKKDG